jgi:hypothetical protein
MKSKLLIIASHLSTGGAPQFTLNKIELLKDDYDIWCIEYDFLSPHFVVQRNKIIDLLGDKFISLGDNKFKIKQLIDDIKPDIISIEELSESFMDLQIVKDIYTESRQYKIIETTHSSHNQSHIKIFLPDKFTFVSKYSQDMYNHLGVESCVIEYPIDKKVRNKEESQRKLNLDPNYTHVLNVGLFTEGKNQGYAFEIARKVIDKKIKFHFVGNLAGNFQHYWEPILKDKPENCEIWGEKDNVQDFIEACDVFLFTSRFELNPLVIKETLCYDIPILMFNLHTYGGTYDKNKNVYFLNGNVESDSNLLLQSTTKKQRGYVLYTNKKYFDITKKCAESIRTFSDLPILVYQLDFFEKIDIKETTPIMWKCELNESDEMYIPKDSNFYINRANSDIYKLLIQRPLIVKDALDKYLLTATYVDSDSVATKYVDNIFDLYNKNLNYPHFVEGVYDYLFFNGRGGAESKEDLSTTLEHPACELFSVNQKIRERYRQTGYFVSSQKSIPFLEEWYDMCTHPEVLDKNEWYAPYNEETIANVLLWKKGIIDGLPSIYSNGNLETIDKIFNEIGFNGNIQLFDNWLRIPDIKENLLFIHGEKNIETMDKMIKKLKEINDI